MRLILLVSLLLIPSLSWAAPKADLWPYWQATQANSTQTVDHQRWQQLLDRYLVVAPSQTRFRYSAVTDNDQYALGRYLRDLAAIDPRQLNRREQFAYWVNLYNAQTVKLILAHYPVSSITKIGGFFSFGPWDDDVVTINGKPLSLNDIEHRILRPIWRDPRIHYAVNCASLGCPDLLPRAFTANNTDTLLEQAAKRFINSDKGVKIDSDRVQLSSIYDWYGSDFGTQAQLQQHLNRYRTGTPVTLQHVRYDYDWRLNAAQ
ncbi:DUF547 domain-containing protein [Photobacterium japonica]|uniref:DUF547 domain-containing protein n=1 Tax=Photobacterium japonica TaxID=2910235 RepID=UPI003D0C4BB1